MQLSEMLGLSVHDAAGRRLGTVTDVRLALSSDPDGHPGPPSVFGLVVSPRTGSSYLGYELSQVRSPAASWTLSPSSSLSCILASRDASDDLVAEPVFDPLAAAGVRAGPQMHRCADSVHRRPRQVV